MRQLQQLQMEERRRAAQNQTIGYRAKPAEEEEEEEQAQQGGMEPLLPGAHQMHGHRR